MFQFRIDCFSRIPRLWPLSSLWTSPRGVGIVSSQSQLFDPFYTFLIWTMTVWQYDVNIVNIHLSKKKWQIFRKKHTTLPAVLQRACLPPLPEKSTTPGHSSASSSKNRFQVSKNQQIRGEQNLRDGHTWTLPLEGWPFNSAPEVLLIVRIFELFLPGSCGSSRRPHRTLDSSVIPIDLFMESWPANKSVPRVQPSPCWPQESEPKKQELLHSWCERINLIRSIVNMISLHVQI